ncbi:nanos homolog 2 [Pelodytes ibericus]
MEFDPWKDYLQLAMVVQEMIQERSVDASKLPPSTDHLDPALSNTTTMSSSNGEYAIHVQADSSFTVDQTMTADKMCNFCKHNGESRSVYTSHNLKDPEGAVVCPVLRKYTCPLCGATGDSSHTLKYCPVNQNKHCLYRKSGRNSAGRKIKR